MSADINLQDPDLLRFNDSPDAGMPECKCSYCGFVIGEDDFPFRFWPEDASWEIRLHLTCFEILTGLKAEGHKT